MIELEDCSDAEWAKYLEVSERKARAYFQEGIIHGAYKNSRGEWQAAGNGLNQHLTYQNMARHHGWELDEYGDFIDPRISSEIKEAFKPFINARPALGIR